MGKRGLKGLVDQEFEELAISDDEGVSAQESTHTQENQDKFIYSWMLLKDNAKARGIPHIFGVSCAEFTQWLEGAICVLK